MIQNLTGNSLKIIILIFSTNLYAEWHHGVAGSFIFGPDKTQNAACDQAHKNALNNLLKKISGETISSFSFESCQEKKINSLNELNCENNEVFISLISAEIIGIKNEKFNVKDISNSYRKCTVNMSVNINKSLTKHDPNFNFFLKINNNSVFQHCGKINFFVEPTQQMYFTIFFYENTGRNIKRIYPRNLTYSKLIKEKQFLTNEKNEFIAINSSNNTISGVFLILATKIEYIFNDEYPNYVELNKVLIEIPRNSKRLSMRPYIIYPNSKVC